MLNWFATQAPIKTKFDALIASNAAIALASVALTLASHFSPVADSYALVYLASGLAVVPVLMLWHAKRVICIPYVDTVLRMEGLAAGDLVGTIRYTEHQDCVGRLTRAMAVFRKNAEDVRDAEAASRVVTTHLGQGLERLARSDLTYRITEVFGAGYDRLRADYNGAMDAISAAMATVSASTTGINTGAVEIRQASDDLSQRTEQQAASLEETAAAMDQITSTVRQTAENAARANRIVGTAKGEAEDSGTVVRRAVDAMGGIERTSAEISDIITVIDGIAFQTNLLALNAGVEAARAGDAGKGFAVVASEVRALAQRSAEAAKDVKSRIGASAEQVQQGVAMVNETGKALERIIGRIGEIDGLVSDIAASAEQQATGLQEVNTAVAEMDSVTQQNAAMVEEATAAARSLAGEADALAKEIAHFTLGCEAKPAERVPGQPVVHQLQARAAKTARRLAPPQPVRGNTAVAVAADDWSEF